MRLSILLLGLSVLVEVASSETGLEEAQRLSAAGQTADAEAAYQRVIVQAEGLSAAGLNALGLQLYSFSRYREAEVIFRRSLAAWDQIGPEPSHDKLVTELNLGTLLRTEGRFPQAETILRNGLQQAESAAGPDSVDAGRAASSLAALYQAWGKPGEAEPLAVRANAIFDKNVTGTAGDRINNRRVLAAIYLQQRRYDQTESLLRPLLQGAEDRLTAGVYNDLAIAELGQNRLAEAESLSRKALAIAERLLPPGHPVHAAALNTLAQSCRFQGNYLEAEKYYRQAISILEDSLGRQHPETAKAVMNLAAFYHQRGRETGAEELYRRVAATFDSVYGPNDPTTLVARDELADVLRAQGRFTESEKFSRAALASLESALGQEDPRVVRAMTNYARLLEDTKRTKQAAALRAQAQGLAKGFREPAP